MTSAGEGSPPDPPSVLEDGSAPATARDLLDHLSGLGIRVATVEHEPVFTVEEARARKGAIDGAATKNLFLRDKKGVMWLLTTLADATIDLRQVAEQLGHKRLSFGSPQRLMRYLGVIPGAVTPFAVMNDHGGRVRLALDEGLKGYAVWNFHPLDNGMTTSIGADDMVRFLASVEHPPIWVAV